MSATSSTPATRTSRTTPAWAASAARPPPSSPTPRRRGPRSLLARICRRHRDEYRRSHSRRADGRDLEGIEGCNIDTFSLPVFPPESAHVKDISFHRGVSAVPPGEGLGQSEAAPGACISTDFGVFHLNVCGFDAGAHTHLLDALLSLHNFPEFVALTETHLTPAIESPKLSKYVLISRRDRPDHRGWGGVALFARHDVADNIVFTAESPSLELVWHTLHSDVGPILLGVWYRPPLRQLKPPIRLGQNLVRERLGLERSSASS